MNVTKGTIYYKQINDYCRKIRQILEGALTAIYLHGSAAMDAFHLGTSDLDLLVITDTALSGQHKRSLAEYALKLSGKPYPLEFSVLSREDLAGGFPLRFQFHFSEAWRAKVIAVLEQPGYGIDQPEQDEDLAAHVAVTLARGITLFGPPPTEVLPAVPRGELMRSLATDLRGGLENLNANPGYAILNACRSLAWLHTGSMLAKDEGGEWFLAAHPGRFDGLIRAALERKSIPSAEEGDVKEFVAFMRRELAPFWAFL